MAVEKVGLRIDSEVTGVQDVDRLVSELEQLDGVSTELIDSMRRSAEQIRRLTEVNQVIESFRRLKEQSAQTAQALKEQQAAAGAAAKSFRDTNSAISETTAKQSALKQTISELQGSLKLAKSEFANLKNEIKQGGTATAAQAEAYFRLERTIKQTSAALKESKSSLSGINAENKKLSSTLQQQSASMERTRDSVRTLKAEQQGQLSTLQRLRTELQAAGVSTNNLAAAQARIRTELQTANASYADGAGKAQRYADAMSKLRAETNKPHKDPTEKTRRGLSDSRFAADALRQSLGLLGSAFGAATFVDTTRSLDTINKGLSQVLESSEAAAKEFEFIRSVADKLGIDLLDAGQAYLKLAAAAKDTALEGEESRRIFEAVAGSMSILGRSSNEIEGALNAIQQIISKNTVSMEELRLQLGDRLPGALQIAARAIGGTTEDLVKLVSTGQLTAGEFLPNFSRELEKTFGINKIEKVDNLTAAINRFRNQLVETVESAQAGRGLSALFDGLDRGVSLLTEGIQKVATYVASEVELGKAQSEFNRGLITQSELEARRLAASQAYKTSVDDITAAYSDQAKEQQKVAREKEKQDSDAVKRANDLKAALNRAAEELKGAQEDLGLGPIADEISESEKKIVDAFGTIAERSNQTNAAFQSLQDVLNNGLSPRGISVVSTALNDIVVNGKDSDEVIRQLRQQLAAIEPGAKVNRVVEAIGGIKAAAGESQITLELLKQSLSRLEIGGSDQINAALKTITQNGVESETVIAGLQNALASIETPQGVLEVGRAFQQSGVDADTLNKGLLLIRDRLGEVESEAEKLRAGVAQVNEALQGLGVESSAELVRGFDEAAGKLDFLRESGQATSEDLKRAFFSFAEDAIGQFENLNEAQRQQVADLVQSQAEAVGLGAALSEASVASAAITGNVSGIAVQLQRAKEQSIGFVDSTLRAKEAAEQELNVRQRATGLIESETSARLAGLRAIEQAAVAQGDENRAKQARAAIVEEEIRGAQRVASAKFAEAKAAEDLVSKIRAQAVADGVLTEAEKEAIAASEDSARAKRLDAQESRAAADAKQSEAVANERLADAARKAAEQQAEVAAQQQRLNDLGDFFTRVIQSQEARLSSLGDKAVEVFRESIGAGINEATRGSVESVDQLAEATQRLFDGLRLEQSLGVFSQIAGFFQRTAAEVEIAVLRQQSAADAFLDGITAKTPQAEARLLSLDSSVDALARRFNLLDQSNLEQLSASIETARRQVEQFEQQFSSLEERILGARAALEGNEAEFRAERELARTLEEIANLKETADREELQRLNELERVAKANHKAELQRIDEERKARSDAERERNRSREEADREATDEPARRPARERPVREPAQRPSATPGIGQPANVVVLPMPPQFAEQFIRNGLTENVIRDAIRPGLDRLNKFRA